MPHSLESFSSLLDVAITRAPVSLANCRANNDTPPLPSVTTVSPGFRRPSEIRACQAVTAAQGKVAASSNERCSGIFTSPFSCRTTDSANTPPIEAPIADFALLSVKSPSIQVCMKMPATRSPGLTLVTPSPTAATSPAQSEQGTIGSGSFLLYLPLTTSRSRKLSDTARVLTTTCPGPGAGSGRSDNASASIPNASRISYAFISVLFYLGTGRRGWFHAEILAYGERLVGIERAAARVVERRGIGVNRVPDGCELHGVLVAALLAGGHVAADQIRRRRAWVPAGRRSQRRE